MKQLMQVKKKNKPQLRKLVEDTLLVFELSSDGHEASSFFFVVGHINYSTWRFSLVHLKLVCSEGNQVTLQIPEDGINHSAMTSVQFFVQNVDFSHPWRLGFWTVLNDDAVVLPSEMRADLVEAEKYEAFDNDVFWKGSSEEQRLRRAQQLKQERRESKKRGNTLGSNQRATKQRRKHAGDPSRPWLESEENADELFEPLEDGDLEDALGQEDDKESQVSLVPESGSDAENDISPPSTLSVASLFGNPDDLDLDLDVLQTVQGEGDPSSSLHIVAGDSTQIESHQEDEDPAGKVTRAAPSFQRDERQSEHVFTLPDLGEIRYSFSNSYMRAYCAQHGRQCTRQRTVAPTRTGNQGRPLGLLTAWLQEASQFAAAKDHIKAGVASYDIRCKGREHALSLAGGKLFAEMFEQKLKSGEPEEPRRLR